MQTARRLGELVIVVVVLSQLGHSPRPNRMVSASDVWPRVTTEVRQASRQTILNGVIRDLLANPELAFPRSNFGTPGTPGGRIIGLDSDSRVPWPKGYVPTVPGYQFEFIPSSRPLNPWRASQLGIRIDRFDIPPGQYEEDDHFYRHPIVMTLFNIGNNGEFPAGLFVFYGADCCNGTWKIELSCMLRP